MTDGTCAPYMGAVNWVEMKRWSALLLAMGLAVACASAGPAPNAVTTPTPTPTFAMPSPTPSPPPEAIATPRPSLACGGFHLVVINRTPARVLVWINDARITDVAPEAMIEIVEMFWRPQLPSLPWDVQITRQSDGTQLLSRHFAAGEEGAKLVVYDENTDLAFGPCGSFG